MLIIKTAEDRERCTSCYGNIIVELTMEEVVALFSGATLGDPRIKTHVEDHITVIDSGRLVSMSIVPEHNVADENLKVRRVGPNAEN